ncbi:hypothetical protein ACFYUR_19105 [Micromonospora haikouensis]
MNGKVVQLDEHRRRTERGRDEQVLIEADRIRDGLTSQNEKRRNSK